METILFHSNVLSKDDVPFINEVSEYLIEKECILLLTGWNPILPEWNLATTYLKLPESLNYFDQVYNEQDINLEFEKYNLSTAFLLDRFNWWFPQPKNESEKLKRLSFLHFHLHHYLKIIKQQNPSLLLIWNGNDPRQYILSKLSENFGIKKLFLERGPLPSVIFYDNRGVLNNSSVSSLDLNEFLKYFDNYKYFEDYNNWYNTTTETLWAQPNKFENSDLRKKLGITKDQKITIFIGQVDNDIQSKLFSPYFKSNLEAFEWFVQYGIIENHFVIGKHHPKSEVPVEKYQSIIKNRYNVIWTDQFSLEDCLKVADYIVTVNSSVIFDALLYKKPVFALGKSLLSNKDILYEYSPNQFEDVLKSFYNSLDFEDKLKNFKNVLEFLLRENLIFTKNEFSSERFTRKLFELKESNNNINDIFEHNEVTKRYLSRSTIKKKDDGIKFTLKNRLKKYIKCHFTRIFLKK